MHSWLALVLAVILLPQQDTEARIIEYLQANVEPGRRVVVSELFNDVFTSPEERAALDRLYNAFFKIPLFLAQFQTSTGEIPSLQQISEQFNFGVPGQADVMLRIMEADPRVPPFFDRDARTGEITRIDIEPIRRHPQFGRDIERTIAGWEGRPAPSFSMETFGGEVLRSERLAGVPHMIYVWFTNCPPCVRTAPLLVDLDGRHRDAGFQIVGVNADRYLELPYDDQLRAEYLESLDASFTNGHLTSEMQNAFGGVSVFPTMFFVDRQGVVVRHFVNFQEPEVLEEAIRSALD